MTRDEFEMALDLYGADLQRWPATLRAQGEAMVDRYDEAKRLLAEAQRLEGLLAEAMVRPPIDPALVGKIVASVSGGTSEGIVIRPTGRLAVAASALIAASLIIGFAVGLAIPPDPSDNVIASFVFGDAPSDDSVGGLL